MLNNIYECNIDNGSSPRFQLQSFIDDSFFFVQTSNYNSMPVKNEKLTTVTQTRGVLPFYISNDIIIIILLL